MQKLQNTQFHMIIPKFTNSIRKTTVPVNFYQ